LESLGTSKLVLTTTWFTQFLESSCGSPT